MTETLVDKANYIVYPEANSKHNNPIWILGVVLIAKRVGGTPERGSGVSHNAKKINGIELWGEESWNEKVGSGKDVGRADRHE